MEEGGGEGRRSREGYEETERRRRGEEEETMRKRETVWKEGDSLERGRQFGRGRRKEEGGEGE